MKYISYLVYLLLLCFIYSCNDSREYVIGVSQCSNDEWRTQMNNEILRNSMLYDGIKVKILSSDDNNQQQIQDIRQLIDEGVDLLVISPNQAKELTPVVSEAYDRGIPVILVDRKIASDKYTAYIGADNTKIGEDVAHYVGEILKGTGNVVEIAGLKGSTSEAERHKGFVHTLSAYPGLKLLALENADWQSKKAEMKMTEILRRYPKIDLVYAQNDRMASGAYLAAKKAGREKQIKFIGTDALMGKGFGLDMVLDKQLAASFIYPTGGDAVIETALAILHKQPYKRENLLSTTAIDASNAHVMQLESRRIQELDEKIEFQNSRVGLFLSRLTQQWFILIFCVVVILVILALLTLLLRVLHVRTKLNRTLTEQKQQLEEQRDQLVELQHKVEEATNAKLVFFTNISHDFRTPLTLIADPIENMLKDNSLDDKHHQLLKIVERNVKLLLNLVNQILDFRKFENGKMTFKPEYIDLRSALESWNEAFAPSIRNKHVHFEFKSDTGLDYRTMADGEKLQRIYFNLMSNALKYVPSNGKVVSALVLRNVDGKPCIGISVFNTGSYISDADRVKVFDRFYQADNARSGSGIGLALAKVFAELHNGRITVDSEQQTGTTFTLEIPNVQPAINMDVQPTLSTIITDNSQVADEPTDDEMDNYDPTKTSVLIIDDNADIRSYVSSILSSRYSVLEAQNGSVGLKVAVKYVPDIIICDVMMPVMDGIECCRQLKAEPRTSHIPVIMLTARAQDEQRIEGYDCGADSYIAKPFNSELLLSRINNLINNRHQLKKIFNGSDAFAVEKEDIGDMDKDFTRKFFSLIRERMGDSSLNVEDIGKDIGYSRVQLYRKIKALTNYSPVELLRIERLKRADSLLKSTDESISEICYDVGFSSPSYFAKCYREQYGESPSDVMKRRK